MNVNPDPATYEHGTYRFLQKSWKRDSADLRDCDVEPLKEIRRFEEVKIIDKKEVSGRIRGKTANGGCNFQMESFDIFYVIEGAPYTMSPKVIHWQSELMIQYLLKQITISIIFRNKKEIQKVSFLSFSERTTGFQVYDSNLWSKIRSL